MKVGRHPETTRQGRREEADLGEGHKIFNGRGDTDAAGKYREDAAGNGGDRQEVAQRSREQDGQIVAKDHLRELPCR